MGSSITRRLADTRPANESRAVEVACRRLGDCITEPVDFLKLDIEGAETRVLRDLGNRLGLVRRGYIEYHYGPIHDDNALGELLSILEKAGFQYRLAEPAATASQMPLHGRHLTVGTPWSCSIHFSNPHG